MVNFLQAQFNKPSAEEQDAAALKQLQQKTWAPQNRSKDNGRVVVEGVGNLMHHIARCCQPIPGDEIVGFITQGRGISVHRADCDQLAELQSHAPSVSLTRSGEKATPRLLAGRPRGGKRS
jgi:GTP pyrophosphokinase